MLEEYKAVAQQVVNELYRDNLIPFKLFPGIVICLAPDDYTVRFFDSRLYSLDVTCHEKESFKEVFRAAVLDKVDKTSGRLDKKTGTR